MAKWRTAIRLNVLRVLLTSTIWTFTSLTHTHSQHLHHHHQVLQYKLSNFLMALATSPPSCNQISNLTSLNLSKRHKHNGWRIFDKCFSQSELLFHNAPVLNSLSGTIQSNVNGAQLSRTNVCQSCTNLADEKHFHSTCGLTFLWLSNTFVLKSFAL